MDQQEKVSFFTLLGQAGAEAKAMLRLDVRLLRAEMEAKLLKALTSGVWAITAAGFMALAILSAAAGVILLLIWLGLAAYLAAFIVSILFFGGAIACWLKAKSSSASLTILPNRTIANVQKDIAALKEAIIHVEP